MPLKRFATNWLARLYVIALATWTGGFTFYSGVVIPILHDRLGDAFEVGLITRSVTDYLNAVGTAAILVGWLSHATERRAGPSERLVDHRRLLATTVLLIALAGLHRRMDRMLDAGTLAHFYNWHRVYLWMSVAQWLVNLSLLIRASRVPTCAERGHAAR